MDKRVPLTNGQGGPQIGWATVHEDGTADMEVFDESLVSILFDGTRGGWSIGTSSSGENS